MVIICTQLFLWYWKFRQFCWIPTIDCWEISPHMNILYRNSHWYSSMKEIKRDHADNIPFPFGCRTSHKVPLNSNQWLLRNSSNNKLDVSLIFVTVNKGCIKSLWTFLLTFILCNENQIVIQHTNLKFSISLLYFCYYMYK